MTAAVGAPVPLACLCPARLHQLEDRAHPVDARHCRGRRVRAAWPRRRPPESGASWRRSRRRIELVEAGAVGHRRASPVPDADDGGGDPAVAKPGEQRPVEVEGLDQRRDVGEEVEGIGPDVWAARPRRVCRRDDPEVSVSVSMYEAYATGTPAQIGFVDTMAPCRRINGTPAPCSRQESRCRWPYVIARRHDRTYRGGCFEARRDSLIFTAERRAVPTRHNLTRCRPGARLRQPGSKRARDVPLRESSWPTRSVCAGSCRL